MERSGTAGARPDLFAGDAPAPAPPPAGAGLVADVLLPLGLDTAYSYAVPPGIALNEGDHVSVPLGPRASWGVVWALRPGAAGNLKAVSARLDVPPLPAALRRFVDWVAAYTLNPRGSVLSLVLRRAGEPEASAPRSGVAATGSVPARLTAPRQRVLAAMAAVPEVAVWRRADLARAAGVSAGVVDALADDGALHWLPVPEAPLAPPPDPGFAPPALGPEQAVAAADLAAAVARGGYSAALLEGVTGSGKTEVYFEAVAAALAKGDQVLILMPEIALTEGFLARFAARFGARPALWHSDVPPPKRRRLWRAVATGEVRAVAGARSALFLPFQRLGLIVVDEEHEGAYKQDDGAVYHARDMAVVRARLEGAPVVLASATPSVETRVNAASGRYRHLLLPSRFGGASLPAIEAIDLRREGPPRDRWIAPRLEAAVREALGRGEQALLFLNRRGYAPLTLCRACGHRWRCPDCSAWLVAHRFRGALQCHHCGHREPAPKHCPACGTADALSAVGPGVERLAEEAGRLFPGVPIGVLSSDGLGGAAALREQLAEVAAGRPPLVIGTQLVAKGHHFPLMTLVGVVDADVSLASGDLRAAERTHALLAQVTGRAGRERPGRALLQTYDPAHPVMRALIEGDSAGFYAAEIAGRREAGMPPFGRLAAIVVSAPDRAAAEAHARALARAARVAGGEALSVLGPAEAPIAVVRGRHRFRLLLRAPRAYDLQGALRAALAAAPRPRGGVRAGVDVDPVSFL